MYEPTFQDLRDRYVLENDRGQVTTSAAGDVPQLENARCPADSLANRLPRRPLPMRADEVLSIGLYTVVDCEQARKIIATLLDRTSDIRAVAVYEVLGRWDLAVKVAAPAGVDLTRFHEHVVATLVENGMAGEGQNLADFTDHRLVLTSTAGVQAPAGGAARFLVLDNGEHYDRLRVQRSFLFVERYLNELNREMGRLLTWFEAQKTNLLVFTTDETGWLAAT